MNWLCYLAGPIEYVNDFGINWREEYDTDLDKLNILCVHPHELQKAIISEQELADLKKKDVELFIHKMRYLIHLDLRHVTTSDFIVIKWDGEKTTGTIGEAQAAFLAGVPVYLVSTISKKEIPGWFLACCTEVFSTKEDLLSFLEEQYCHKVV